MIPSKLASVITMTTGGGYDIGSTSGGQPSAFHANYYRIEGSPTLTTNFSINHSTIAASDRFDLAVFHNTSSPTLGGNHVYILGALVPDELYSKEYWAVAAWNGATWDVSIHPDLTATGVIIGEMIADAAVTATKIDTGAVIEAKIGSGAVTAAKIGTGAVTADKIGSSAVTEAKIGTGAVTADKIGSGAVTADKIGSGAVTESKIGTGAVTADKIGAGAITTAKIATRAITAEKIAAGTFDDTSLASSSVTEAKIASAAVTEAKVGTGAITNTKLGSGAVTVNKVSTDLKKNVIMHTVSVITYSGVTAKIRVPWKSTLTNIHTCCIATMDNTATNYERLLFQDNAGNNIIGGSLTAGKLTFPDAFTAENTLESTVTGNNAFAAGELLQVTPEKNVATTGVVLLTLEFTLSE